MKLFSFFVFALVITSNTYNVHAGVVKDIFGTIHESTHKIKEDVGHLLPFIPHKKTPQTQLPEEIEETTITVKNNFKSTTQLPEPTKRVTASTTETEKNKESEITTTSKNLSSTTQAATKEKADGRENFTAECLAGYKKTDEGKCKPIF